MVQTQLTTSSQPAIQCRLGAVFGVECRPGCRDMPLYAAICRSLERKSLIFLGFVFSCQRGGRRLEPCLALQI
jgi:hypothetical protein